MNGVQDSGIEADELQRTAATRRQPAFQRLKSHLWRRTTRGFLLLIPLIITIFIVRYLATVAGSVLSPFVDLIVGQPFVRDLPGASPITWAVVSLLALAVFYVVGRLVTGAGDQNRLGVFISRLLSRIPVVKSIYDVANQATEALSAPRKEAFSRVVFLEWPRPGVKAMGLVTGSCRLPQDDRTMLVVYIATVPNPTSGMLAVVPEDEVIDADITVEDAMKIIFSGGIVLPDRMRGVAEVKLPGQRQS